MLWEKPRDIQTHGWLPTADDPKELKEILSNRPLLISYPYLFKTITLSAMELGFTKVTRALITHPKCPKNYPDFIAHSISKNNPDLLKELLKMDFATPAKKQSVLSLAIKANSTNCLEVLLALGFKPNFETHEELVECLLHKKTQNQEKTTTLNKESSPDELEENFGEKILKNYPYKVFKEIKSKKLCPIKQRIAWLKATDPPAGTALMFQKTQTLTNMILDLETLVKKTEKTVFKLHFQKELKSEKIADI